MCVIKVRGEIISIAVKSKANVRCLSCEYRTKTSFNDASWWII